MRTDLGLISGHDKGMVEYEIQTISTACFESVRIGIGKRLYWSAGYLYKLCQPGRNIV
jgi:hypothetical protein